MRQKLGEALKKARALSTLTFRGFPTEVNAEGAWMRGVDIGHVFSWAVVQTLSLTY